MARNFMVPVTVLVVSNFVGMMRMLVYWACFGVASYEQYEIFGFDCYSQPSEKRLWPENC